MANEFEDVEAVPDNFGAVEEKDEDLISSGSMGTVYDWSKAPERTRAPPRINLDKKVVTIEKAEIVLPSVETPWEKTRDKMKDVKFCTFVLHYSESGQQEFYSGVRVFKRENKYSHPTISPDRQSQASALMGAYADFKKKDMNEVSLREFMGFLNSKPKAVIKSTAFKNPTTGETIMKNIVEKFI